MWQKWFILASFGNFKLAVKQVTKTGEKCQKFKCVIEWFSNMIIAGKTKITAIWHTRNIQNLTYVGKLSAIFSNENWWDTHLPKKAQYFCPHMHMFMKYSQSVFRAKNRLEKWYCSFFVFTILNFPRLFSAESGPSKVRELQNSVNKKCTISEF